RFFGVLLEHYAGAFPAWLSPVQAVVVPISERHHDYARQVAAQLQAVSVRVHVDDRNEKMNAKIREHALQKVPFILVVGDKEQEGVRVNVRTRGKEKTEDMGVGEFVEKVRGLIESKSTGLEPKLTIETLQYGVCRWWSSLILSRPGSNSPALQSRHTGQPLLLLARDLVSSGL
ncbi:MAG TPA: His/Gly/Thr/Pro-type tRNA ligase C-terminal domain-containing protein, partial [Terriglobales bacterium]|nr:His/Gly/Thr/Pro-type tRNA ligase C-terminal domain-containing protein [Terriglobales bacterium]